MFLALDLIRVDLLEVVEGLVVSLSQVPSEQLWSRCQVLST